MVALRGTESGQIPLRYKKRSDDETYPHQRLGGFAKQDIRGHGVQFPSYVGMKPTSDERSCCIPVDPHLGPAGQVRPSSHQRFGRSSLRKLTHHTGLVRFVLCPHRKVTQITDGRLPRRLPCPLVAQAGIAPTVVPSLIMLSRFNNDLAWPSCRQIWFLHNDGLGLLPMMTSLKFHRRFLPIDPGLGRVTRRRGRRRMPPAHSNEIHHLCMETPALVRMPKTQNPITTCSGHTSRRRAKTRLDQPCLGHLPNGTGGRKNLLQSSKFIVLPIDQGWGSVVDHTHRPTEPEAPVFRTTDKKETPLSSLITGRSPANPEARTGR
ncbi:hypothetical protein C4D60_Mb03t15480 [Musa balbisiana]|uniref:Uncharacterized protein n=1 Tax=Musa balbisiana TaxID=52838 RepID=A0A4S8JAG9_MUSBA|nr:hypothetical protein C4D60_Mb03t15480 [Musa balbisiana]